MERLFFFHGLYLTQNPAELDEVVDIVAREPCAGLDVHPAGEVPLREPEVGRLLLGRPRRDQGQQLHGLGAHAVGVLKEKKRKKRKILAKI